MVLGEEPQKFYIFKEGAVVFWNVLLRDREEVLHLIKKHEIKPYSKNLTMNESESLTYKYVEYVLISLYEKLKYLILKLISDMVLK